ncbi:unnamed protein product [Rhizoctonia solani]|uniref:Uncharacterized protein n=1 Tax=Rhizoctonia solani TaxID=456999 RepID=A0A8H3GTN2_9AGAM|nr:unnamed protein product [Rhizoctonia solani]
MESMFGKFPLANRPKMTRRKRKNLNLAPGAPSAASTSGTRRGGNSPTTEPANNSADMAPSRSSYTERRPTVPHSSSGPDRRAKGTQQSRRLRRGGNPYSWMPSNDNPSSPTTEETLPITPRSDMSSTFSFSPSPGPSSQRPQSPIHRRRNAVSAGPQRTDFGFLTGSGFAPASAPLMPTQTWPTMSTTEGAQRLPESTLGGLVQTRSDGALEHRSQALSHIPNAEHTQVTFGAPQIAISFNSHPTNYATSNYQPSHSFGQPSNSRIDSSLAEQTFWPDFTSTHTSYATAQGHSVTPSVNISLGSLDHPNTAYVDYSAPYTSVNETGQAHILGLPDSDVLSSMVNPSTESYLQDFSYAFRRIPGRPSQEAISLASLAFNHTSPTQ